MKMPFTGQGPSEFLRAHALLIACLRIKTKMPLEPIDSSNGHTKLKYREIETVVRGAAVEDAYMVVKKKAIY